MNKIDTNLVFVRYGIICGICILSLGLFVVVIQRKQNVDVAPILSLEKPLERKKLQAQIITDISKLGAQEAYDRLKHTFALASTSNQHMAAHLFGTLLYQTQGIEGISVCDNSYAFGCYHSFFGSAVTNEGIGILDKLDRACFEKFGLLGLGCPHGIGHGLGEYMGPEKLNDQLAACEKLLWKGPLFGCQGGVFMEYNMPAEIGERVAFMRPRTLDPNNPYAPCTQVPEKFQRACYLELPTWWLDVFQKDYQKIGTLCAGISTGPERQECFRGIGYSVGPITKYSVDQTILVCEQVGGQTEQVLCRAGAAWSFFANPDMRGKSDLLCQGVSSEELKVCREQSDLLKF